MNRPAPRSRRPRTVLLVAGTLTALLCLYAALDLATGGGVEEEEPASLRGAAPSARLMRGAVPRIRLPDAAGGQLDTRDLLGRPYVVTFAHTGCVGEGALVGGKIGQALAQLGAVGRRVPALIVSLDPARDTRTRAREWLATLRLPFNVRYLIGTRAQLRPVWERYAAGPAKVARPDAAGHPTAVWLVDSDGRPRAVHDAEQGIAPVALAHDLGLLLDGGG